MSPLWVLFLIVATPYLIVVAFFYFLILYRMLRSDEFEGSTGPRALLMPWYWPEMIAVYIREGCPDDLIGNTPFQTYLLKFDLILKDPD